VVYSCFIAADIKLSLVTYGHMTKMAVTAFYRP